MMKKRLRIAGKGLLGLGGGYGGGYVSTETLLSAVSSACAFSSAFGYWLQEYRLDLSSNASRTAVMTSTLIVPPVVTEMLASCLLRSPLTHRLLGLRDSGLIRALPAYTTGSASWFPCRSWPTNNTIALQVNGSILDQVFAEALASDDMHEEETIVIICLLNQSLLVSVKMFPLYTMLDAVQYYKQREKNIVEVEDPS